jgi:hypothetical protein
MTGEQKERWMELCEQAANEQDGNRLIELVVEITRLLDEKEARLRRKSQKPAVSDTTGNTSDA